MRCPSKIIVEGRLKNQRPVKPRLKGTRKVGHGPGNHITRGNEIIVIDPRKGIQDDGCIRWPTVGPRSAVHALRRTMTRQCVRDGLRKCRQNFSPHLMSSVPRASCCDWKKCCFLFKLDDSASFHPRDTFFQMFLQHLSLCFDFLHNNLSLPPLPDQTLLYEPQETF